MKKTITLSLLFLQFQLLVLAQVPSSCDAPQILLDAYAQDLKHLTIQEMQDLGQTDIELNDALTLPMQEGLAAIFNATSIPERDSVFSIFCIHHNNNPLVIEGMIVSVDPSFGWTSEWENLNTTTGYTALDDFLATYGFEVESYISSINAAVLRTEQCLNIFGVIEAMNNFDGVVAAEGDFLFGGANRIFYSKVGDDRFFDFSLEWEDCFDGCDNQYVWKFKVASDCSVEFLGTESFYFFGWVPFPDPTNCNLVSDVSSSKEKVVKNMYPNPASNILFVEANQAAPLQLVLHNIIGQEVYRESFQKKAWVDIQGFPEGIYLVGIQSMDGKHLSTERLVIKREL